MSLTLLHRGWSGGSRFGDRDGEREGRSERRGGWGDRDRSEAGSAASDDGPSRADAADDWCVQPCSPRQTQHRTVYSASGAVPLQGLYLDEGCIVAIARAAAVTGAGGVLLSAGAPRASSRPPQTRTGARAAGLVTASATAAALATVTAGAALATGMGTGASSLDAQIRASNVAHMVLYG